ncbi:MAG: preprotein translocase subunit SecY [Candidatus Aenigmatarchaeota archaeon]
MGILDKISSFLPGVTEPKSHLSFRSRLKWTGIILLLYLVMGQIVLYGVEPTALARFQFIEMILGSSFGTLVTLGIGPIVSASIILQLLVGSKIIPWDLKSYEGRKKFHGTQKLLTVVFALFEAYAFVAFGAIRPASSDPTLFAILIGQIAFGAFVVLLMDELISKWGIGSGVSLFIAAGVTKTIFVRAFNPLTPAGQTVPSGLIPQFVVLLGTDVFQAFLALLPLVATIVVFLIVVYVQSMKVEIPLAFASFRGFSRRWPLNLIYTSNIPVILMAALLANLQLMGSIGGQLTEEGLRCGMLGCYDSNGAAVSGLATFFQPPSSISLQIFFLVILVVVFAAAFAAYYFKFKESGKVILISIFAGLVLASLVSISTTGLPTSQEFLRSSAYLIILVTGSTVFSIFWISTSGMDARTVSEQIEGLGMQMPGFRRDPRIVEQVLNRYIPTLAIISGMFIGLLAALADFTGALGTGTGILLTVTIVYSLYEQIASRYAQDMNPAMRKFFE